MPPPAACGKWATLRIWQVSAVHPPAASVGAPTTLTVAGSNFARSGLACTFSLGEFGELAGDEVGSGADGSGGFMTTAATFIDASAVACTAPAASEPRVATLSVSASAGGIGGSAPFEFTFVDEHAPPAIKLIEPAGGPTGGSSLVRVAVANLRPGNEARCKFGHDEVRSRRHISAIHLGSIHLGIMHLGR